MAFGEDNMKKLVIVALVLCLAGCSVVDSVKALFKQASAVAELVERSLGLKPEVTFNWHNGKLIVVRVDFPRLYLAKPLAEVSEIVRASVEKEFEQKPGAIVIGFVIKHDGKVISETDLPVSVAGGAAR
jgi:hypothetical protein